MERGRAGVCKMRSTDGKADERAAPSIQEATVKDDNEKSNEDQRQGREG